MCFRRRLSFACWAAAAAFLTFAGQAADVSVKVSDQKPPSDVHESIRTVLREQAVTVSLDGKTAFEIWLRDPIPVSKAAKDSRAALDNLKVATLLGVIRVPDSRRDYRDDEIYPGTYTLRYSRQPQDGNHLGTADYPYFALLTPIKFDNSLDGIKTYDALTDASARDTATGHPVVLSLFPVSEPGGELPRIESPANEHAAVRLKTSAQAGSETNPFVFDLVVRGTGHL